MVQYSRIVCMQNFWINFQRLTEWQRASTFASLPHLLRVSVLFGLERMCKSIRFASPHSGRGVCNTHARTATHNYARACFAVCASYSREMHGNFFFFTFPHLILFQSGGELIAATIVFLNMSSALFMVKKKKMDKL